MALEELSFKSVNGQMHERTDEVITIAHPEHSSGELKTLSKGHISCQKLTVCSLTVPDHSYLMLSLTAFPKALFVSLFYFGFMSLS